MADLQLDFRDLDAEAMPDVCMKCGAPSAVRPIQTFSWKLPGKMDIRSRRVPAPLCGRHRGHFKMRYFIAIGGGAASALLFLVCIMLIANGLECAGGLGMIGVLLFTLAWGFAALIWIGFTRICVQEITHDTITLRNVSPEFVGAYRTMVRNNVDPAVEKAARERWGGPRGHDSKPPRPRRPDDKRRR